MPVNSIDSGNTWFRLRAGRSEPQTMSTKLSGRETSSDRRSFNDVFNDSASTTQRNRKHLIVQGMSFNVQAWMRVGSIPTLDSLSKRYDAVKRPDYSTKRLWVDCDKPWTRTLATSEHLKDVRAEMASARPYVPGSPCFINVQLLFTLVNSWHSRVKKPGVTRPIVVQLEGNIDHL